MQHAVSVFASRPPPSSHIARPRSDALLCDIYACPSEPEHWSYTLDQLCAVTGVRSAVIQSFRLDGTRLVQCWSAQDSHTRNHVAPRSAHLASESNPRLDARRVFLGLNRLVRDEDLFGHDEATLIKLRGQLGAVGLGRFIGTLWQIDNDTYASMALHRAPEDERDFSANQLEQLDALSPHLQQAMRLSARIGAVNGLEVQLRRQFDHLRCGMVVCDVHGRVSWLNGSAERLLAEGHALRLQARTLVGRKLPDSERLLAQIGAASRLGSKVRYLALGSSPGVLHLALQPLANLGVSGAGDSVLLIMTAPETDLPVAAEALAALFGLTPAESSLTSALVSGLSLEQYSVRRQVSLGTVRGQLKQVLAKTGVGRQSDLVRLVLSSAAAQVRFAA